MVELLKSLIPNFSHFQNFEIKDQNQQTIGHQVTVITESGTPFGGGTASDVNLARRICAAECIERAFFLKSKYADQSEKRRLLMDEFPTSCGFSAGFAEQSTVFRAICEAVERRAWSKWIDDKNGIPLVNPKIEKPLAKHYLSHFDKVYFFQTSVSLDSYLRPEYVPGELVFSVVIGVKGNGVFPGSRVTTRSDEMWEHGLLEAWRHLHIYQNELRGKTPSGFVDQRIKLFGDDGVKTLDKVRSFNLKPISKAQLKISELVKKDKLDVQNNYYVYRALCEDYIGWDKGDEKRFIY